MPNRINQKDERVASLAHELRNPLGTLASAAERLKTAVLEQPEIERIGGIILRQTDVMGTLIDELLDVSRLDAGRISIRRQRLDLRHVVRNALDDRRNEIARAHLQDHLALPEDPVWVHGDSVKLGQILGNLLSNGIKFTPAPGDIHLSVECRGDWAILAVRDTGIGMSADLLGSIFERYRQARPGAFGGLGLGLPIAHGLVKLHGGIITVSSDGPGKGSEVMVRLPLVKDKRDGLAAMCAASPAIACEQMPSPLNL